MGFRNEVFAEDELVSYASKVISEISGNILGEKQKTMVISRLKKRMMDLNIDCTAEYLSYIKDTKNKENDFLVSILTTHHTFFFREIIHFQYLEDNLESIVANAKKNRQKKIRVLSLACSKGHEVYSLATFLDVQLKKIAPEMDYEILGTDIDRESVGFAQNGVYRYKEVSTIPLQYLSGNWSRGKGKIADYAKIKGHIAEKCKFRTGNLLELRKEFAGQKFDIVFCRNVFIYFEQKDIISISNQVLNILDDGGYFFTGVSESLNGLGLDFQVMGASVYHKGIENEKTKSTSLHSATPKSNVLPIREKKLAPTFSAPQLPEILKVLCVDDSATVLKMLDKIFTKNPNFEVVGTAENGLEAEKFLKENPGKVDVVTLDIHMPEMDGITYLQKNYNNKHPATIIVSSASRDDATHSMAALKAGASDFVEKPALNNIAEVSEEIYSKLQVAYLNQKRGNVVVVDTSFSSREHAKVNPDGKAIILSASLVHQESLKEYFSMFKKMIKGDYPPTIIVTTGNDGVLPNFKEILAKKNIGWKFELLEETAKVENNHIYLFDTRSDKKNLKNLLKGKEISIGVFGTTTAKMQDYLMGFEKSYLLVEDFGDASSSLKDIANDLLPVTSFPYLFNEYFAKKDKK